LEAVEAVVMPRAAIEWGYQHLEQGDRMGRLIAEYINLFRALGGGWIQQVEGMR
jgi:hypothetical protein